MRIQEKKNSCGAAAILNALRSLGTRVRERSVRKLCGTDGDGTHEAGMLAGLGKLGCYSEVLETDRKKLALASLRKYLSTEMPVILAVDEDSHWVTLAGTLGDRYVLVDSERTEKNRKENGVYVLSVKELLKRWRKPDGTMYGIAVRKRKKNDYGS